MSMHWSDLNIRFYKSSEQYLQVLFYHFFVFLYHFPKIILHFWFVENFCKIENDRKFPQNTWKLFFFIYFMLLWCNIRMESSSPVILKTVSVLSIQKLAKFWITKNATALKTERIHSKMRKSIGNIRLYE